MPSAGDHGDYDLAKALRLVRIEKLICELTSCCLRLAHHGVYGLAKALRLVGRLLELANVASL